jgi:hypothetical protein
MTLIHVLRDLSVNQNFFSWLDISSGPRSPQCRGLTITLRHTTLCRIPLDEGRPDKGTSLWLHTTFTRDRHQFPRRYSNPQSLQANGRRPTPYYRAATGIVLRPKNTTEIGRRLGQYNIANYIKTSDTLSYLPCNRLLSSQIPGFCRKCNKWVRVKMLCLSCPVFLFEIASLIRTKLRAGFDHKYYQETDFSFVSLKCKPNKIIYFKEAKTLPEINYMQVLFRNKNINEKNCNTFQ